jgi:antirestriction protein ArdC
MKKKTDIYQEITDSIIASLEQGVVPWLQPWENRMPDGGILPRNYLRRGDKKDRGEYHGINVLLLWGAAQLRGFTSSYWLTKNQVVESGAWIKREEFLRGTDIVFYKKVSKKIENEEDASYLLMRTYTVWNFDQLERKPTNYKEEQAVSDLSLQGDKYDFLHSYIKNMGVDLRHGGNRAFYAVQPDYVQMPPAEQFNDMEAYWAVLFHECVHWSGHGKRLNREFGKRFGDEAYATEELVAELGSAFLCATHGIRAQQNSGQHAAYIETWIKALKSDKRIIVAAAKHASKAAEFLDGAAGAAGGFDQELAEVA